MSDEVVTTSVSAEADTSSLLLTGKVAIITGGTSAIGRACAARLATLMASDAGSGITGQCISVDGGTTPY